MTARHRLLIVDDESKICSLIEKAARPLGFEAKSLTDPSEFTKTVKAFLPSVVVMDLKMPRYDGIRLLQQMRDVACNASVIVISGMDQRVLKTAEKLGLAHELDMLGVLQKPIDIASMQAMLRKTTNGLTRFSSDEIEAGLAASEFVVHYQPKIAKQQHAWVIDGAEALVRWQHPTRGLVMPSEFLPLAEESHLIGSLTEYILCDVLRQMARWEKGGLNITVAVNISAHLL